MKSGWAPKVRRHDIIRLYARDAEGIYDEDLINEVGYGLLSRCEDMLTVTDVNWRGWRDQEVCPDCSVTLNRNLPPGHTEDPSRNTTSPRWNLRTLPFKDPSIYDCPACGWRGSPYRYRVAYRHNGLRSHRFLIPCYWEYVEVFPTARTPQQRMMMIDKLLHFCHGGKSRLIPIAGFFIDAPRDAIIELPDGISQGKWSVHRRRCPRCDKLLFGRRPDAGRKVGHRWTYGDYCSRWCHDGEVMPNDPRRARDLRKRRRQRELRRLRGRAK